MTRPKATRPRIIRLGKKPVLPLLCSRVLRSLHCLPPPGWLLSATAGTEHPYLTVLEPRSRFEDNPLYFQVVCPQNGTAVLKALGKNGGARALPVKRATDSIEATS